MLKLIMYSHHIYEKHVLPIPRLYIGSWIAHIELQVIQFTQLITFHKSAGIHARMHIYIFIHRIFTQGEVFLHWPHI